MTHAIRAEGIGKRFHVKLGKQGMPGMGGYRTLRDGIVSAIKAPLRMFGGGGGVDAESGFWALRDISFEVAEGEAVGLIGRNGAGKSTLLKVLGRISRPSTGTASLHGRVGSLLEVGTSFHPELTGRENIFLNGAILGMSREEVRGKFDEIVDFSEVERFLDVPVKRYSSGMFIRLAFGVAAHLEPEVLLIDEVLAVGDAAFQKKCLGRMGESTTEGRTVLFVSHNMAALERLCSRAIWIDGGEVVRDGPAGDVVAEYLRTSFTPATEHVWDTVEEAPGSDDVRIRRAEVRPVGGTPSDPLSIRSEMQFTIEYWNLKPGAALSVHIELLTERGETVFRSSPIHEPNWHGKPFPEGLYRSTCVMPGDLLNDGTHVVRVGFRQDEGLTIAEVDDLLVLEVRDDVSMRGACNGHWPGAVRPALSWSTERLDGAPLEA
jgi:lipopolysaccharide transport system ATP-binding protein